eukprot:6201266-Pleurochrysis_carterae.AAC.1
MIEFIYTPVQNQYIETDIGQGLRSRKRAQIGRGGGSGGGRAPLVLAQPLTKPLLWQSANGKWFTLDVEVIT